MRPDGFISLNAGGKEGEWRTKPLTFMGRQLVINFSTSAAGAVRVEVQNGVGEPISGFSLADCPTLYGDAISRTVSWKGGDLAALAGRPIRLRFVMKESDLYSLRFE
jgi:hypothetical protein